MLANLTVVGAIIFAILFEFAIANIHIYLGLVLLPVIMFIRCCIHFCSRPTMCSFSIQLLAFSSTVLYNFRQVKLINTSTQYIMCFVCFSCNEHYWRSPMADNHKFSSSYDDQYSRKPMAENGGSYCNVQSGNDIGAATTHSNQHQHLGQN